MEKENDKALKDALMYTCNLPKIYAEELELDKGIFSEL